MLLQHTESKILNYCRQGRIRLVSKTPVLSQLSVCRVPTLTIQRPKIQKKQHTVLKNSSLSFPHLTICESLRKLHLVVKEVSEFGQTRFGIH